MSTNPASATMDQALRATAPRPHAIIPANTPGNTATVSPSAQGMINSSKRKGNEEVGRAGKRPSIADDVTLHSVEVPLQVNGKDFSVELHFSSSGGQKSREAKARIRFTYFPIIQGKESILTASRVFVHRQDRVLPEAHWALLPFMEPRPKRNVEGQILRRLRGRVQCVIDAEEGFTPTTPETDLEPEDAFTVALKSFGKKQANKETSDQTDVGISLSGQKLSFSQLEKLYEEWLKQMHSLYDQEVGTHELDETLQFINVPAQDREGLGIISSVIRVYRSIRRNDFTWQYGQKVKIVKGATSGFHRTNTYATLEHIIVEGNPQDFGCEARLICRPIEVPPESGCLLVQENGSTSIRLGFSFSIPVNVIDTEKFITVDDDMWEKAIQRLGLPAPSGDELLGFQRLSGSFSVISGDQMISANAFQTEPSNSKGKQLAGVEEAGLERNDLQIVGLPDTPIPCAVGQSIFYEQLADGRSLNNFEFTFTQPSSSKGKQLTGEDEAGLERNDLQIVGLPDTPIPCAVGSSLDYEQLADGRSLNNFEFINTQPSSSRGKQLAELETNDLQIVACPDTAAGSSVDYEQLDQMLPENAEESWDCLTKQELEDEIQKNGEEIKEVETAIRSLLHKQSKLKNCIFKLHAEMDLSESIPSSFACKRNIVREQIARRIDSAAAAICRSSEEIQWEFAENLLGFVASIGSVRSDSLSRMLAHYLGERQMLGVVFKCEEQSLLDVEKSIQALAVKLKMPPPMNYHLYCMENIRPYPGSVSDDPRRELQLPNPRLPSGECPPGFLGYAVNLIEIDVKLRPWRTASGHGLRETLLYQLFGELQVYLTRDSMMHARCCIDKDALSLDGAILRANGVISLAHGEAGIAFPVCSRGNPTREEAELGGRLEAELEAFQGAYNCFNKAVASREQRLKRLTKQATRYSFLCYESMFGNPPLGTFSQIKEEQE